MKLFIASLFLVVLVIFIKTACPTIYIGDSGETCSAAFNLGISHPPGYPIYTEAAKIFSLLPIGDIAYRINLLASICATLALLFIFLCALEFIKYISKSEKTAIAASIAATVAFAFSSTFWFEAVHAKGGIYTLAVLISAAALYFAFKYYNSLNNRYFHMAIYTAGFMPFVHLTTLPAAVFVIVLVLIKKGITPIKEKILPLLILILSFITPLFYLFIRAASDTKLRWADTADFNGVIGIILRKAYISTNNIPLSFESFFFKIKEAFIQYGTEYMILVPFVVLGFVELYKINKKNGIIAAAFISIYILMIAAMTGNSFSPLYLYVNKGFYLIINLYLFLVAAFGMNVFILKFASINKSKAAALFIIILSFVPFVLNYERSDLSRTYIAYDHAMNIEKSLVKDSTLLCGSDTPVFNIAYMKYVKNRFLDINLFDANANLFNFEPYKQFRGHMTEIQLNLINSEIVQKAGINCFTSEFLAYPEINIKPQPFGILYRFVPMSNVPYDEGGIAQLYSRRDYLLYKKSDIACRELTSRYLISQALYKYSLGDNQGFENYRYLAQSISPNHPGILSSIAGAYFYGPKDMKKSAKYLEEAILIDPNYTSAIRLLIHIYTQIDPPAALKWAHIYVNREWDKNKIEEVKKEFKL